MRYLRCKSALFFLLAIFIYLGGIIAAGLDAKPVSSDLAVVLGNEVLANGEPAERLQARLNCAIDLYRKHLVKRILVSGGVGKSGYDEATVMKNYLLKVGIASGDILQDSQGINTQATAINTAKLNEAMHFSGIVIVSQYYHLPRCMLAFRRAGLTGISADYPRYFETYDLYSILREAVALPVYFAKMPRKI